jgi:hypothetical protein
VCEWISIRIYVYANGQVRTGVRCVACRWGDHYWMWDVLMDCSQTRDGWFEFKTFVTHRAANDGWEADIKVGSCNGTGVDSPPIEMWNKHHVARCGYVNQFVFNSDRCTIDKQSCGVQTTSGESTYMN